MYAPVLTDEEIAESGFEREDFETEPAEVWPDTLQAFELFLFMQTQWRRDSGPCGLDYNVLFRKMDRLNLTSEQYDDLEADIRVMESAALETIRAAQSRK